MMRAWMTLVGTVLLIAGCPRAENEDRRAVPTARASQTGPRDASPVPAAPPARTAESLRYRCLVLHEKAACCDSADPLGGDGVPSACCQDPLSASCQYPQPKRRPL